MTEADFLRAIQADPHDEAGWLALADWLEERSDPRAELVRLQQQLRREPAAPGRLAWEERVRTLLASGVRPCVPGLANSIGMKLALIPAGTFTMGSPPDAKDRNNDEEQHEVEITRPFYLGVYEVTQEQYEEVMGKNPSYFSASGGGKDKVAGQDTSQFPVETVSWEEAKEF